MKKYLLIATLMMSGAMLSFAQYELPKSCIPYYLEDTVVKKFEKTATTMEAKVKGMGYGGVNMNYKAQKDQSKVRFSSTEIPEIIIKVPEGTETMELVVVTKAKYYKRPKGYRLFIKSGASVLGSKDFSDRIFTPNLEQIDNTTYKLVFDSPLEKGEYAFMPIMKGDGATGLITSSNKYILRCFGID